MFAKAPRFQAEKPSDVPPPGFYEPKDVEFAPYKKSGFLEKSDRKLFDKVPDGPGPSQYQSLASDTQPAQPSARRVSVSAGGPALLKQQVQELTAENARMLKERQDAVRRLEAKLEQAEGRVRDLVKEKGSLQSEAASAMKEQRLALERETATRAALEKAEVQAKQSSERASKYTALQRRLADLEKLHTESKSKFTADKDALRSQLETARDLASDRQRQLDQLLSQRETDERRLHELKRAHGTAEKENQALRQRLQVQQSTTTEAESSRAEKERLEASLRLIEARHASECSELKRKIEAEQSEATRWKQQHQDVQRSLKTKGVQMQELEKKVTHLTSEVESERRRKHAEDTRARDRQSDDLRDCRAQIQRLEKENRQARDGEVKSKEALRLCETRSDHERAQLQDQLQHIRIVLAQVAEQYGKLVTSMQSSSLAAKVDRVQADGTRIILETRLAARESQIRSLRDALRAAQEQRAVLTATSRQFESLATDLLTRARLHRSMDTVVSLASPDTLDASLAVDASVQAELSRLQQRGMLCWQASSEAEIQWIKEGYNRLSAELESANTERQALSDKLSESETVRASLQARTSEMEDKLRVAEASVANLKSQLSIAQGHLSRLRDEDGRVKAAYQAESDKLSESLKAEKAYTAQLRLELAHGKAREAALTVDIDNLHEALAGNEGYKKEYQALLGEVKIILSRNALAEDEAERLSRFNAEILGHQNPSQKILYVDKIRRELADVKQKLIVASLERDDLEEAKHRLLDELTSYKSVAVPLDNKPRSTMTRVTKVPFGSRSVNTLTRSVSRKKAEEAVGDRARTATWSSQDDDEELKVEDLRLP